MLEKQGSGQVRRFNMFIFPVDKIKLIEYFLMEP